MDHGQWGIEAQIIEAPDDLRIGHRFENVGDSSARDAGDPVAERLRVEMMAGHLTD